MKTTRQHNKRHNTKPKQDKHFCSAAIRSDESDERLEAESESWKALELDVEELSDVGGDAM
jgi:hypothetical protein